MMTERGFSLLEIAMSLVLLLALAIAVVPVFSQNLVLERALWERRLAVKWIESELEAVCNFVQTPPTPPGAIDDGTGGTHDFEELRDTFPALTATPPELNLNGVPPTRTVTCLNASLTDVGINAATGACPGGETIKRVRISVTWTSQANQRAMQEPSTANLIPDYLISRSGSCG